MSSNPDVATVDEGAERATPPERPASDTAASETVACDTPVNGTPRSDTSAPESYAPANEAPASEAPPTDTIAIDTPATDSLANGAPESDTAATESPTGKNRRVKSVPKHFAPKQRRPLRAIVRVIAVVASVGLVLTAMSVVGAMSTPGNSNFTAKWADWLRSHHAGYLANDLERWYYTAKQPSKGGRPTHLNSIPLPPTTQPTVPSPTTTTTLVPPGPQPPPPVNLVVMPALPGEGQWQATGPLIDGHAGMYVAQFRADTVYTGQITTAVWIDPTRLRIRLVPGAQEPGGDWSEPPYLADSTEAAAVAAFNGGFRFQDAKGGIYLDGQAPVPLRDGAQSVVINKDGSIDIGTWNQELSMTPEVESVLQNLVPLVDNGMLAPAAANDDQTVWGYTLGASTIVARSGIGITSDGALVYVAGPALSVRTLAEALLRAGAVRAMALDINPEWVTFNFYQHPDPSDPTQVTATKLYPEMQRPATRYLGPTRESRDFFSVSTQ
ncbi:MAG: phosphodiester glycosidase family protein [Acidimicrobiales bacterium]